MHPILEFLAIAGIDQATLVFLLFVPIIATLFAFSRQVVGLRSFGLYVPLLLTFVFQTIGIGLGLFLFLSILILATLARLVIGRFRLLYIPRMALVLTSSTIAALAIIYVGVTFNLYQLLNFSILPILIIIFLVEEFVSIQIKQNAKTAFWLTAETLFLVIIAFYLIEWTALREYVLSHPFVIIVGSLVINIILARWSGLRLTEFWRFRAVLKKNKS